MTRHIHLYGRYYCALLGSLFASFFFFSVVDLGGGEVAAYDLIMPVLSLLGLLTAIGVARLLEAQHKELQRRKAAEEALRTAKDQLQLLLDQVDVGIALTDANHRILEANAALAAVYRRERASFTGGFTNERGHQPIVEGERETRVKRGDGTLFTALEKSFPLRNTAGEVTGYVKMVQDITSRKEAEEARLKLERKLQNTAKQESLSALADGMANDFNNLLMAVLGNADLVRLELPPDHRARPYLGNIDDAARRATALCKQMSAYASRDRSVVEPLHLGRLIHENLHILQVSVSKNTRLKYHQEEHLALIDGDPFDIRQVILNLVTNASDALGKKTGMVSITTGEMDCGVLDFNEPYLDRNLPEGRYVYCEVADTGCGMTTEVRDKIFDPFFTTKCDRRGLGMASVLSVVRAHRGAVKIFSEPGQGTSVRVLFPVAKNQKAGRREGGERQESGDWRGEGCFLVIDDEATVRGLTQVMLERMGYRVLCAEDGVAGLACYEANRDDIRGVLLDLFMPRMDGEETFKRLRERDPQLPIVVISGHDASTVAPRLAELGAVNVLHKPFHLNQLRTCIRRIMVSPSLSRGPLRKSGRNDEGKEER